MARREVFSNDAAELQLAQESYGPGREVAHGPWITGIYKESYGPGIHGVHGPWITGIYR